MNYSSLLESIRKHVTASFASHPGLPYHSFYHTESVVQAATDMAQFYKLSDRDQFIVVTASWFHDVAYYNAAEEHEKESAKAAEGFLKGKVDDDIIKAVKKTVRATTMPQNPATLLEQIICDADLFNLGSDDFKERSKALRKEREMRSGVSVDKKTFRAENIAFLQNHHYHTEYAQKRLNDKKQKNLQELVEKQQGDDGESEVPSALKKPRAAAQQKTTDKGVETMFRISSQNHQRLSDMADNKAHIMITVNSIILSVVISFSLRGVERYSHLAVPSVMLLTVNVITLIFAVLATRPSIPDGTFSKEDLKKKKVNLLFFGNFYRMSLEDYSAGMFAVMEDYDFLYHSLIKDIYSQGVVLGRKYRLLRIGYNVFMFGIVVSVIAFIVAASFYGNINAV